MNEILFILHCLIGIGLMLGALKIGKEMLMAYVTLSWLLANLFVTKQISLFGYEVTAADVYVISAILGTAALQEIWGKKSATRSIWISFFMLIAMVLMSRIHLLYESGPHDMMQTHFSLLFQHTPRLVAASLFSFFVTGRLEVALLAFGQRFTRLSFALRSWCASSIVVVCDTCLFSFLGLYGVVASIGDVILVSLTIKLSLVLLMTPALSLIRSLSPKVEQTA